MLIYPVVISIPMSSYVLERKRRLSYLRVFARKSVRISSKKSGLSIGQLSKDKRGVPLKQSGVFWSISHKGRYAGGVVANRPIGIDIEKIVPKNKILYNKVATSHEWELGVGGNKLNLFFRYWTAKEAVLKAERVGLVGLSDCFIGNIVDEMRMIVRYGENSWCVEHFYFGNYIAAVSWNNFTASWTVVE